MTEIRNIFYRCVAVLLSLTITTGLLSGMSLPVYAKEATVSGNGISDTASGNELPDTVSGNALKEEGFFGEFSIKLDVDHLPEHAELSGAYIEQIFYGDFYEEHSAFGRTGEDRLSTEEERQIYASLKTQIQDIAAGKLESTTLQNEVSWTWSAEDLGASGGITESNVKKLVENKISRVFNTDKILKYLMMDCPYDFYWFDKTEGAAFNCSYRCSSKEVTVHNVIFKLPVAANFRKDMEDVLTFDTELAGIAQKSKDNAVAIAESAKTMSDYEKLCAFKKAICDRTSYNINAKETENSNPWQLLWVFDDDESTSVVCEGYSKAFQYLCDLSDLTCYTVTGTMNGEGHMWNIVTLNGKNYLVDVTNCDTGMIGADDKLFLVGTPTGGVASGYTFALGETIVYQYDDTQLGLLGEEVLTLEKASYDPSMEHMLNAVTVTAAAASCTEIKLSWGKNDRAEGYEVYQVDGNKKTKIAQLTSNKTVSYSVKNLMPNTSYSFVVSPYHTVDGTVYVGNDSKKVTVKTKALSAVTLKASSVNYNQIKLTWTKSKDATGYEIYQKNSDGNYVVIKTITSGSTLEYTNTKLKFHKTYYYKVVPILKVNDKTYTGAASSVVSAKTKLATPKIRAVKSVNYKTLQISWGKISGASGYEIYRSKSSGSGYKMVKRITSGSTVSYKDTSVTPNGKHYYKVRAYKTVDGKRVYGSYSPVKSGKSLFTKVKGVKVKAVNYTTMKISWKKVSGAAKYQIYYSTSKDSGYKKLKTVDGSSYTWKKPNCGTTYYFKVRAIKIEKKKSIYGDYSAIVSKKTSIGKTTADAAKKNYNSIKISWKKVTGAEKYDIYWATSKNGEYQKLKTTTATTYTHKGRSIGKKYYYKVRAIRQKSKSSFSDVVSAKTSLGKVTGLKTGKYGSEGFKISWKAADGATAYKVYRSTSKSSGYKQISVVTKTSYVDVDVLSSKTYYYKVVGYRGSAKTATAGPVSVSAKLVRKGIDVSEYQGSIDWKKVKKDGINFAMLRIVKGRIDAMSTDARFEEYYKNAAKAGVDVGVYRYCYATSVSEAKKEAKKVLAVLNGRKLDYPVVLDMEDSSLLGLSKTTKSKMVLAFKDIIEDAGYEFAMYANLDWINNQLDMTLLEDVDLWLARWRPYEWGPEYTGKGNLVMWQYSSEGKVDGINGYVDLDVSY